MNSISVRVRLGKFGCDKDGITEHKLRLNIVEICVAREFVPHSPHDRFGSAGSSFESRVNIVHQVVATVDRCSNCGLNALSLEPWLAMFQINCAMSTEERIPFT